MGLAKLTEFEFAWGWKTKSLCILDITLCLPHQNGHVCLKRWQTIMSSKSGLIPYTWCTSFWTTSLVQMVQPTLTCLSYLCCFHLCPLSLPYYPLVHQTILDPPHLELIQDIAPSPAVPSSAVLRTLITLKTCCWNSGMPKSRVLQSIYLQCESWKQVHLWRSQASWISIWLTFDVTTQTGFKKNSVFCHLSSTT